MQLAIQLSDLISDSYRGLLAASLWTSYLQPPYLLESETQWLQKVACSNLLCLARHKVSCSNKYRLHSTLKELFESHLPHMGPTVLSLKPHGYWCEAISLIAWASVPVGEGLRQLCFEQRFLDSTGRVPYIQSQDPIQYSLYSILHTNCLRLTDLPYGRSFLSEHQSSASLEQV